MDFIKGFIPSNPIDAEKRERLAKIAEEVMKSFGKQYLLATKDVVLQESEDKAAKLEKKHDKWERRHAHREKKRAEHGLPPGNEVWDPKTALEDKPFEEIKAECLADLHSGMACRRPRDPERARTSRFKHLFCTIVSWTILDADSDPFVAYVVAASLGSKVTVRFRRYTQFKQLHKAINKQFKLTKPFPPANSMFGGRNLSAEFVTVRLLMLNEYLQELCNTPGAECNPHVLAFFGMCQVEDPLLTQIEDRAIEGTRLDLNVRRFFYDDLGEAMAKIVMFKIREDMWQDIVNACPPAEKARKAALKVANKSLETIVKPIVETGVRAAQAAAEPVQKKLMEKLVDVGTLAVQTKHEVEAKLREAMSSALSPIVGALSQLVTRLTADLMPSIIRPLVHPIQSIVSVFDRLVAAFATGDESAVVELYKGFMDVINGIGDKITESMKESVANLLGDRDKLVVNVALNGITFLLEVIVELVKSIVLAIFQVDPFFDSLYHMMRCKTKLLGGDPSNPEAVYKLLDDLEDDMDDVIEDNGALYMRNVSKILSDFEELPGKAGLLAGQLNELFEDFRKVAHDKYFKRFSRKFSDYVWGAMNLPSDVRPWKDKVEHSFALAFRSTTRHALKGLNEIGVKVIVGILEAPVLSAIEEHITPLIHDALDPINKALPSTVADFLDVEGMVNRVIECAVRDSCKRIVLDQESVFKQEFTVSVGFVYGAPFLPDMQPFPYVYVAGPNGSVIVPAAAEVPTAPALAADPAAMAAVPVMAGPVPTAPAMGDPMAMPGAMPVDPNMAAGMNPGMMMPADPNMAAAPVMGQPAPGTF